MLIFSAPLWKHLHLLFSLIYSGFQVFVITMNTTGFVTWLSHFRAFYACVFRTASIQYVHLNESNIIQLKRLKMCHKRFNNSHNVNALTFVIKYLSFLYHLFPCTSTSFHLFDYFFKYQCQIVARAVLSSDITDALWVRYLVPSD